MPRQPQEYRKIHAEADRIELKLARSVERAMTKVRNTVSINELGLALAMGDVKRAVRLVPLERVKEALSPAGTTIRDAVIEGGKVGARILND